MQTLRSHRVNAAVARARHRNILRRNRAHQPRTKGQHLLLDHLEGQLPKSAGRGRIGGGRTGGADPAVIFIILSAIQSQFTSSSRLRRGSSCRRKICCGLSSNLHQRYIIHQRTDFFYVRQPRDVVFGCLQPLQQRFLFSPFFVDVDLFRFLACRAEIEGFVDTAQG